MLRRVYSAGTGYTMPATAQDDAAHASPSADAVNGRVTGALFFIGFGAAWLFFGLKGTGRATPSNLALLALTVAVLLAVCMVLFRRARSLPSGKISPEAEERMKRMFTAVNIIQWVSIFTAVAILNVLHRPDYIAPAIVIIVGLHLLPLAQSFRYAQHYVTGALLVLTALACMARLPLNQMSGVCSLGAGIILVGSAVSTLLRCLLSVRGAHAVLPAEASAA